MSGDGAKTSKMATRMPSQMTPPRQQEKETYGEENNLDKHCFKAEQRNNAAENREWLAP